MVYAYLRVHEHNTVDYTHDIVISAYKVLPEPKQRISETEINT